MQIQISKRMGKQTLSLSGEEQPEEGLRYSFREQMLLHNSIDGLLPCEIRQENDRKICSYEIEGFNSLEKCFSERKLNAETLQHVLEKILRTILKGHEFMLSEDDYVVRTDMIYLDAGSEVCLVYFPGYAQPLRKQLNELGEYLMNKVDYRDERAVLLVYSFYMKTKEPDCGIESRMNV